MFTPRQLYASLPTLLFTLLLALAPTALLALYFLQTRLIYIPQYPPGSREDVWTPDKFGFASWEELWLIAKDGTKLHAYWIDAANKNCTKTIICFHANAGNMGHRLPIVKRLVSSGLTDCNFFMLSYRGYGKSEGSPDEQGIKLDAQAAVDHVLSKRAASLTGGSATKLIAYGQSIGGAVAIEAVYENQAAFDALIVENTFTSMRSLVPDVIPMLRPLARLCTQLWENDRKLGEIVDLEKAEGSRNGLRTLLVAGARDELIPLKHTEALWAIIKRNAVDDEIKVTQTSTARHWKYFPGKQALLKAQLSILAQGTHNDTCIIPEYYDIIVDFVKRL